MCVVINKTAQEALVNGQCWQSVLLVSKGSFMEEAGLAPDKKARNNQTYFGKANRLILFHRIPIVLFWETFEGEIGDCGRLK